ncbi:MAG TPA: ABC transporter substrate-binding protein [Ilumatobacteraceae bacterium]|nr:ABC transporter substrate-binding protein [Ilumatobacteraceae bacterium]
MTRRLIGAGLLAGVASTLLVVPNAAAQDESQITLTVGLLQDLDSPNVTAGFLVSSYELWNLQYATLTDKAADDFATIPGLAESWEASDDGLTYTYTLREGLEWSDGEPLTAEDIAWTINTSRDQEWINHSATTVNLDATAVDERTVEIVSSVPDPKLPTMDVYIVPKHVWEPISEGDITTYEALDGVGSGPFTLQEWRSGQSWTMVANPSYWKGEPVIDQVVFRIFTNPDAMVAALQQGEIDAAHLIPSSSFQELQDDPDIVAVPGAQGGFTELGMNGMAGGIGDGHPALLDLDVRHAIHHAIDKDVMFDRVVLGLGERGVGLSVSPDPAWKPDIPEDEQYGYDPDEARRLLDEGGYVDTNGDGIREMPDGGEELVFRYAERSESEQGPAIRDFVTGFLTEIGIGTEVSLYDDTQLTDVIGSGEYDLFSWGWTPFVDPDPMLSYFTCAQVTTDIESIGYNDANWCDERYDALYEQQKVELDRDARIEIVHEMLELFYHESTYVVLYEDADTQAYRTDRFEGWLQQPAETGPVLFSNSSPTYVNLRLIDGGGDDDGGGGLGVAFVVAAAAGVVAIGGAGVVAVRRRSSRDERE